MLRRILYSLVLTPFSAYLRTNGKSTLQKAEVDLWIPCICSILYVGNCILAGKRFSRNLNTSSPSECLVLVVDLGRSEEDTCDNCDLGLGCEDGLEDGLDGEGGCFGDSSKEGFSFSSCCEIFRLKANTSALSVSRLPFLES